MEGVIDLATSWSMLNTSLLSGRKTYRILYFCSFGPFGSYTSPWSESGVSTITAGTMADVLSPER